MIGPHLLYRSAAVILMLAIVIPPLADLVPAMTHGPILNRRHAAGAGANSARPPPKTP